MTRHLRNLFVSSKGKKWNATYISDSTLANKKRIVYNYPWFANKKFIASYKFHDFSVKKT